MATAVRLTLGTASAPGLARFAYGPLLPGTQNDLYGTPGDRGAMSASNTLGHAASAVRTCAAVRRWGIAVTSRCGGVATAVTPTGTAAWVAALSTWSATGHDEEKPTGDSVLQETVTWTVPGSGRMAPPGGAVR